MSHILRDKLFQELVAGLIKGFPNLLNIELPSKEVESLLSTNNLPTVAKNPELIDEAIVCISLFVPSLVIGIIVLFIGIL